MWDTIHSLKSNIFSSAGAFEVKVPLKRKSTETKPVAKTDENEALKISKLSRKPSPIRIISGTDDIKNEESSQENTSDGTEIFLNLGNQFLNLEEKLNGN